MRTAEQELEILRISLARIAQTVGSMCLPETPFQPAVTLDGLAFQQLQRLASTRDAGWNSLAGLIVEEIERMKEALRVDEALRSGFVGTEDTLEFFASHVVLSN